MYFLMDGTMKRSEAVEEIRKILAMNGKDDGYGELEYFLNLYRNIIAIMKRRKK